ncbi:MAG: hypothetical protein LLG00_08330 [Planctomycetaceae bacterium]|nr:hypothetical protein [Planctomycetaceae bacterium]
MTDNAKRIARRNGRLLLWCWPLVAAACITRAIDAGGYLAYAHMGVAFAWLLGAIVAIRWGRRSLAPKNETEPGPNEATGSMASDSDWRRRRFQFSLRTLLLSFIPVALLTALGTWLFRPPPIDVAMTVERFCWYKDADGRVGLEAEVRVTNTSRDTVWYLENPRWYMAQYVDGQWLGSSSGTELPGRQGKDWWSPQEGMQSITLPVGAISEKATAVKVGIPFTTDRFMPKAHWVFTPNVKIVKKGKDRFPEVEKDAKQERWGWPGGWP